ncbi:MAG: DUF2844 domain-containing protein [Burkholderiales bacterium]|nr:DUF2844 domain-containing protein [Burkholderiales bacterium]
MSIARARAALALLAALAAAAPAARAVLGEDAASIQGDALRVQGQRRMAAAATAVAAAGVQVHVIEQADGSTIREYVSAAGVVFAVAWNARNKPRLDELFGRHYADYAAGARQVMARHPGALHGAVVEQGDLVVQASAYLNRHVGRAWLRSQVPAGWTPDALR